MQYKLSGNQIAVINFIIWGLLPLYYQFVVIEDIFELLAIRVLASLPLLALVYHITKKPIPNLRHLIVEQKRSFLMVVLSSLFITISWLTYTYTITHDRVMEASLGFFIAPIFAIGFGIVIQRDKLTVWQNIAIILAVLGVCYQIIAYKTLPLLSLTMAFFFALYALCKKYCEYDMLLSISLETLVIAPFCAFYLLFIIVTGQSHVVHSDCKMVLLFLGSAPMTLIPYLLYTLAISRTSLTMIGLLHYIEPSLQFVLAVWVFHESFDTIKAVSFSVIWLGLIIGSIPSVMKLMQQKSSGSNISAN